MVDSKKIRTVNDERIYLSSYKRTYLYWFLFLQDCANDPVRKNKVNWDKYKGWGGQNYIIGTKFDNFWNEKWVDLFGFKEGGKPKFKINQDKPKNENLRFQWLCHQNREKDKLKIWKKIDDIERQRYDRRIRFKDKIKDGFLTNTSEGDGEVRSRIGRFIRGADDLMDSICDGCYPNPYIAPSVRPKIKPNKKEIQDRIIEEEKEVRLLMIWGWDNKKIYDWLLELRDWEVYGQWRWERDTLPPIETLFPVLLHKPYLPYEFRKKLFNNELEHKNLSSRLGGSQILDNEGMFK
jgi:hypothetical protein